MRSANLSGSVASALIRASPEAAMAIDEEGRVREWNNAAEAMFGYSRKQAVGRFVRDLVVPERLRAVHDRDFERLRDGDPPFRLGKPTATAVLSASGRELHVEATVIAVEDGDIRWAGYFQPLPRGPIADRQDLTMPLREEAARVAHLGTWDSTTSYEDLSWSEETFRIFEIEPSVEPTMEMVMARVHPEDRKLVERQMTMASGGTPASAEFRLVLDGERTKVVHATGRRIAGRNGFADRMAGTMQDVTDARRVERQLAAFHAVARTIHEWSDFDEGVIELLRRLATALGAAYVGLWVPDPERKYLELRARWCGLGDEMSGDETSRSLRLARGQSLPGEAWAREAPVAIGDLRSRDLVRRREIDAAGFRSAVVLPAIHDGVVYAVVELFFREGHLLDDETLRTLSGIGSHLGGFLYDRRGELVPSGLTDREVEVLQHAAAGLSAPEIADRLDLGRSTVKTHFDNIYDKLGVNDRPAAVAEAMRRGAIS